MRVPLDVGRLEAERRVGDAQIEIADRTAALVGAQDGVAEIRVSLSGAIEYCPFARNRCRVTRQADLLADRVVH